MRKLCLFAVILALMLPLFQNPVLATPAGGDANHYILMYQTKEYNSKIGDSVSFFFQKILKPKDSILLFTPMRPINYSPKSRQSQPLKVLISRTIDVLKKDSSVAGASLRNIQDSMALIVKEIATSLGTVSGGGLSGSSSGTDLKNLLTQYRQLIINYRQQRKTNDNLFLKLAEMVKKLKGKKYIHIVYQQDFRIIPDRETMDVLRENSELAFLASESFIEENTKSVLDTKKVSSVLKEAGITLNLIYAKVNTPRRAGQQYREISGDIYESLSKVAKATGGQVITTSKPEAALKKITTGK